MTRFTLQISDQLNQWLTEQARLNHRSKNKQIEHLLELAKYLDIVDNSPKTTYFSNNSARAVRTE